MEKLENLVHENDIPNWRNVDVHVFYGKTGTGKTRTVMEMKDIYKLDMSNNIWFDGYTNQKNLLIDDFYGWIRFGQLLNILDGYKLRLDKKGSFGWAHWNNVYITSNKHPSNWYNNLTVDQVEALNRRITFLKEFK